MTGSTTSGTSGARAASTAATASITAGVVQHAGLDRVGADIVEHDLDLLADEVGRDRQHAEHA